ncbi:MAG: hypothetical protein SWX82_21965 [Cyanobacteriota bacterium]|nr:hypothetical protein [Cyanobacteriota bacterium]
MKKEEGRRKREEGWVKRISQPNKSEKNEEGRGKKVGLNVSRNPTKAKKMKKEEGRRKREEGRRLG